MSRLARLSLANRSLVALASIAIVLFGVVATGSLKQELIPSLQLPMAVTMTTYPGASPDIVEREVTDPIESAISGVDGLDGTTSTSSNGMSVVTAEFTYGTDIDKAVQDLQQSVNRISGDLPDDAEPTVQAGSFDDLPVVVLSASSDLPHRELAHELEDTVAPELRGLTGVRDVEVTGARSEQISVTIDEDKLTKNGLTVDSVTNALQANGVSVPGGDLTTDGETFPVEVGEQFTSAQQIRELELLPSAVATPDTSGGGANAPPDQTTPDGTLPSDGTVPTDGSTGGTAVTPVELSKVATVEEELAPETSLSRTDGKPSIGLSVTKTQDGNTVGVSHEVENALPDLEKKLGDNTELTMVFDQAPYIEDSIEGLTTEGLLGLAFAVLVIMIFLLSLRTTIVTAVSIPMSLLVAMIGLYAGGYSLNILTLGALTVAVGRVVDDSIVVLENIKRHIGYGEEKVHAILTAVREVAGAITASTVTTAGVFLPIAFVGGQTGELFRPFGVTVAIALLASLLVALTIIPVLAYWFVKPKTVAPEEQARAREQALAKERRSPLQRMYVPLIRWTTKHRIVTVLVGVLIFAGTIGLAPLVQTNFLDSSGQTTMTVTQQMPAASSLAHTDRAAKQVEDVLADVDEIETYQVTIGSSENAFYGPSGTDQAQIDITAKVDTDMTALEKKLRKRFNDLDGAGEITIGTAGGGPPGSSNVEILVEAGDAGTLERAAERVERAVENTDGTTDVTNNLADEQPSVSVAVDRAKAAGLGLSEAQVGQAVREAFEGQLAGTVVQGEQTLDVMVRVGTKPSSLRNIEQLPLATPTGTSVKLNEVADVERVSERAEVTHTDGERTASITAKPTDVANLGALTTDLTDRLDRLDLPDGASYTIGGVSQEQNEAFAQLGLAMLAAIAIVFLVMVATFRSLVQPLILLVSVPFAATGAIGLLLLTDISLGVPALIGMLMLVGIVVTNAIVLIDLINQYRADGTSIREAVIEGGRQRLRPVLMTALATICALTPMAFGLTGGGVFISQPLAIVVIGGLVSSTLLTLVLVPTLYTMVESFKERRQLKRERRRARKAGTPVATQPEPEAEQTAVVSNGTPAPNGTHVAPAPASTPETPAPAPNTTVVSPGEPARITVEVVVRNEQNGR